jgi:hypothetical protein
MELPIWMEAGASGACLLFLVGMLRVRRPAPHPSAAYGGARMQEVDRLIPGDAELREEFEAEVAGQLRSWRHRPTIPAYRREAAFGRYREHVRSRIESLPRGQQEILLLHLDQFGVRAFPDGFSKDRYYKLGTIVDRLLVEADRTPAELFARPFVAS